MSACKSSQGWSHLGIRSACFQSTFFCSDCASDDGWESLRPWNPCFIVREFKSYAVVHIDAFAFIEG